MRTSITKGGSAGVLMTLAFLGCAAPEPDPIAARPSGSPSASASAGRGAHPVDNVKLPSPLTTLSDPKTLFKGLKRAKVSPRQAAAPQGEGAGEGVSLQEFDTPIKNQGARGWCTAFGVVGAMENLINHTFHETTDLSEIDHWDHYGEYSMFSSAAAAKQTSIVTEEAWPYYGDPVASYRSYAIARVTSYRELDSTDEVFAALRAGKPVVIGTQVTSSWDGNSDGMVDANGYQNGGHALLVVGYKDSSEFAGGGYMTLKNSWGTRWGDLGYLYLPYDYCRQIECYFIEVSGVEYKGNVNPTPEPTPPPNPTPGSVTEQSFTVVAVHDPNDGSIFRLHVEAEAAALAHVRAVTYDVHETFGSDQYDRVTDASNKFLMSEDYETYSHRWKTNGTAVELDDGRTLHLPGTLITW